MELVDAIRGSIVEVAAQHASDVDERARFPAETFAALRDAKALSAAVPKELGGQGCDMRELAAAMRRAGPRLQRQRHGARHASHPGGVHGASWYAIRIFFAII